jgi:DNA polymerase-3 subunit epsilon
MSISAPNSAQRRARVQVSTWARERIADPSTIFLDTETTGLGSDAEIIDLAVVDLVGNVLIDTLIAPRSPIPPETTLVHGLVDADVAGAPCWTEVYPLLAELVRTRPVVVYNAGFDRRMVRVSCELHGIDHDEGTWHCAMQHYAAWAAVPSSHKRQRYRLHKLGNALASFGLPPGNHRALADAQACRSLVIAMAGNDES